jgi:hypothetical protein
VGATVMDQVDRLRAALADRYELDREIGHGGMAHVYLAHDRQHDRDVAIKVLRPELAAAIGTERFLREIRIEAGLQHPHILPLHDSGSAGGLLYYVMPYLEGETLRDRIRREKQLPLADAVRIAREVADALGCAHAHGIVHRDIKPANILLSGDHAVVADFGIARAIHTAGDQALTEAGLAVGTPEYMSPEQGSGDSELDARSDIYSLGCVLFEMLAGDPPFTGRTAQSVIARHRQDPPPSLRVVRPALPPGMQTVVETALAKVPADRYSSAAAFARGVEEALASPRSGTAAPPRAIRRSPSLGMAAALILVLALAAGMWWSAAHRRLVLDSNKVMVLPLVEHGRGAGESDAGEQVAIMIGSALEHTEPLKWIDGWTWMDEAQRTHPRDLTAQSARLLSQRQRARYFIDGSIVRSGDSATVVVRLHDALADSVVTQASATGSGDPAALPQLGLRALAELLPLLMEPGRRLDPSALRALTDRRPAAIVSWLQGEREYRGSNFLQALSFYRRAVETDTALAVAALKGAQAANWADRNQEAEELLAIALANEDMLPGKYAAFAEGLQAYFRGDADSAVTRIRRAIDADGVWAEAWMMLGEAYYHLFPRVVPSAGSAERAFQEARRLDPEFAPPLFHLDEIALRRGDLGAAESLLTTFRRSSPDSTLVMQLSIALDCLRGPKSPERPGLEAQHPLEALQAGRMLGVTMAQPRCAAEEFRTAFESVDAPLNIRAAAAFGLHGVLVAGGRYRDAAAVLEAGTAAGVPEMDGLYVVDADAGAPLSDRPARIVASWRGALSEFDPLHLWYLGLWSGQRADTAALGALSRELGHRLSVSRDVGIAVVAGSIAARLALAFGDSAAALERLETLASRATPVQMSWGIWQPLGSERVLRAELLLGRGRAREALDVARELDHPQPVAFLLYLRRSLLVRAAAAERLGWRDSAAVYRTRLRALDRGAAVSTQ